MQADSIEIPEQFDVAVVVERRPGVTPWQRYSWSAAAIVAGSVAKGTPGSYEVLRTEAESERRLWRGFPVRLHLDEAESYYYNLLAPQPQAFVVMQAAADGSRMPRLVTLCFDEANAYVEGDAEVHNVPLPAELIKWLEAYVIANFVPEKKTKRKRREWNESQ